ncbi:PD-(D/E)XK nuclease family protein, partial [Vibrio sp. F12]
SVYKEYKNIDIYITDGHKHIIIENKINAGEQEGQIKRYIEEIEKENDKLECEDILVIYLSTNGKDPSKYSLSNLEINGNYIQRNGEKISLYKSISYKKEIIIWLDKCRFEVQNITNLNEAIKQYINVVRIINGDYKEKAMNITSYIKNNKSIYKTALEVHRAMPSARRDIVEVFFSNITDTLITKLGDEWVVEINGSLSTKCGFPFKIYKKSWGDHSLIFGFEFNKKNYYDGCFGIVRKNDLIDIESDINHKFKEEIKEINIPLDTEAWWLHWEWLPNIDNISDFSEYIMLEDNAEEKFIKRMLYFINEFETNSGLLTKINNYLNESEYLG